MEQLNKIEIRGNVGNINILKVGSTRVAHFSVATNFAYKDRNGEPVIETTWHYVTAWGRLRTQKYIAGDGSEKTSYDIIANTMEILGSKQVSPQMG